MTTPSRSSVVTVSFALVVAVTVVGVTIPGPAAAQLGGRPADEWALVLESGRRMATLDIENVVSAVEVEPGAVVADIGAGTGIFTVPLARDAGPEGMVLAVDVAFFHDVIHHIEDREGYLGNTASYMAPGSRMAVVDYRGGHPDAPHGDRPEMQITQDQVTRWMETAGFEREREIELFEEKFFVVYRSVD